MSQYLTYMLEVLSPVLLQMCYLGGDCSVGLGTVSTSGPGTRLKCAACKVARI